MISVKHLSILLVATVVSFLVAWLGYTKGQEISVYTLTFSILFSFIFAPLVVIRLPIFRRYYVKDITVYDKAHHSYANYRAAPVAVGLVSGVTIGLILAGLNNVNPEFHAFCGAVAATIISFYYEPKF